MNRKSFMKSVGATCRNWTWSWSFVNHNEKVVIFGAWDTAKSGDRILILKDSWSTSDRGRKQPAYSQSVEHIKLIKEDGYILKTFPIIYSDKNIGDDGLGPAAIEGFEPTLTDKQLIRVGDGWYAENIGNHNSIPEEVIEPELYTEGSVTEVKINAYERSAQARQKCIDKFGYSCAVCKFEFQSVYGELGKSFIHVHHIIPLSEIGKEYKLNPEKDLIPLCPNCHAMIHRTRPAISVDELKRIIESNS